jgi:hypothetical protein
VSRKTKSVAITSAIGLLATAVGCGGQSSNAVYSFTQPWGVGQSDVAVGKVWAAGSIPLCTRGDTPVTLTSITPVVTRGQVRLDRIVVRKVHPGHTIGDFPGSVAGQQVGGFVVPSPSPCRWPSKTDPFYEVVLMAHLIGPHGGYIKGLRVRYHTGASRGKYTINFSFEFCGTQGGPRHCRT